VGGGGRYILVAVLVNIKHSMGWWSWRYRLLGQAGGGRGEQGRVIVDIAGVDRDCHRHGESLLQPLASPSTINLVSLHHHVEFLINFVVLCFCPWCEIELSLMVTIVPTRTAQPPLALLLVQGINDILVGEGLVGLVVLGVLEEHLVHVGAGILVEFVAAAEDNESYFTVTQHRELVSLFHHTKLPLVKCNLSVSLICYPRNLNFLPSHLDAGCQVCLSIPIPPSASEATGRAISSSFHCHSLYLVSSHISNTESSDLFQAKSRLLIAQRSISTLSELLKASCIYFGFKISPESKIVLEDQNSAGTWQPLH